MQNRWLVRVGLGVIASALLTAPAVWAAAAHSDMVGCDGCHVPHNAGRLPGVPLWNGNETATTFTMYSSKTFQATIDGQPSGPSKLCLSRDADRFLFLFTVQGGRMHSIRISFQSPTVANAA